jgi:hypothetical protein
LIIQNLIYLNISPVSHPLPNIPNDQNLEGNDQNLKAFTILLKYIWCNIKLLINQKFSIKNTVFIIYFDQI